jgi:L-ascorbate metabolism protein UlaG (beta-lactamase superfamily)
MHPFENLTVPAGSVGIHWFGQSSFALKSPAGSIIHIDPYFPRERPADRFIQARAPLMEESLQVQGILLTHDHGDHTCLESIDRIRQSSEGVKYVGPAESVRRLREAGIDAASIAQVTAGDTATLADMTVHTVFAKPPDGDAANDIKAPDVSHLGFVVDVSGARVYISGDPINTFADHEGLLAPIRELQPQIGFLTNHPSEGEFPFFDGSARTAQALGLHTAVPAHYGCFVSRDYDPGDWAASLPEAVHPLIIPYNQAIVYSA